MPADRFDTAMILSGIAFAGVLASGDLMMGIVGVVMLAVAARAAFGDRAVVVPIEPVPVSPLRASIPHAGGGL